MCLIPIGYKSYWSYSYPKRLGKKSRGILGTCGNQYITGMYLILCLLICIYNPIPINMPQIEHLYFLWITVLSQLYADLFQYCVGNKVIERITSRLWSVKKLICLNQYFKLIFKMTPLWKKFALVQSFDDSYGPLRYFRNWASNNYSCKFTQLQREWCRICM